MSITFARRAVRVREQIARHQPRTPDSERVLTWLGELIDHTCTAPTALVAHAVGGAIAARLVSDNDQRLSQLVLVAALGLTACEPAPEFGHALPDSLLQTSELTHDRLWQ